MKVSLAGVRHIALEEGCALTAYEDGVARDGRPLYSIGFGHQPGVSAGDVITFDRAVELLRADLEPREATVMRMLGTTLVSQNVFDALVSAYYNKGSLIIPVVDALVIGATDDAWQRFASICLDSAGHFRLGLLKRRVRELDIALGGVYGDPKRKVKLWRESPRTHPTGYEEVDFPGV